MLEWFFGGKTFSFLAITVKQFKYEEQSILIFFWWNLHQLMQEIIFFRGSKNNNMYFVNFNIFCSLCTLFRIKNCVIEYKVIVVAPLATNWRLLAHPRNFGFYLKHMFLNFMRGLDKWLWFSKIGVWNPFIYISNQSIQIQIISINSICIQPN